MIKGTIDRKQQYMPNDIEKQPGIEWKDQMNRCEANKYYNGNINPKNILSIRRALNSRFKQYPQEADHEKSKAIRLTTALMMSFNKGNFGYTNGYKNPVMRQYPPGDKRIYPIYYNNSTRRNKRTPPIR